MHTTIFYWQLITTAMILSIIFDFEDHTYKDIWILDIGE